MKGKMKLPESTVDSTPIVNLATLAKDIADSVYTNHQTIANDYVHNYIYPYIKSKILEIANKGKYEYFFEKSYLFLHPFNNYKNKHELEINKSIENIKYLTYNLLIDVLIKQGLNVKTSSNERFSEEGLRISWK